MDSFRAHARRVRLFVVATAALVGGPAFAAGPCVLKADANPASLTIPDFTGSPGSYTPTEQKLNGSASRPETNNGGIYQWSYVSGPAGYSLTDSNQPQATFTPADVGPAGATYVLRLTVTGCGSTASLDYPVRVTDAYTVVANAPPHAVASATPNPALEGETVSLDGSASYDPDAGTTLSYQWTQTAGPALALGNATTAHASFVAPNVAATTTYQFRLTVSDGTLTDASTVNVSVAWTNDPPVARLSCPLDVDEGQSITLDGSASSDSDDGIAAYRWQQKNGLPIVPGVAGWTGSSTTFDAPALGYQQVGQVGFVLFVRDASGVEVSQDCDFFIHDVTRPVVSVADIGADADNATGANVAFVPAPTAFDAVDGDLTANLACTPASGSAFPMGQSTVGCSVQDSAGNTGSASFHVTVADLSAPVIAAHDDIAVEATKPQGADVLYDLPATSDKVDGAGVATCAPAPGTFALGSTTVECSAEDAAHNAAAKTHFTVSVLDTTAPAITVPEPIVAEATGPSGEAVTFSVSASDIVDGSVAVSCDHASGETFPLGLTTVTCSAHDSAVRDGFPQGNVATASFSVTVQDTVAPALTLPADIVAEADKPAGKDVVYAATASDAVDTGVAAICSPASGSTFALGTVTVDCSATDASGNRAEGSFSVTVRDTTAPTLAMPAAVTMEATGPMTALAYGAATATDAVDTNVDIACTPASGSSFPVGSTSVTCTATDDSGNATTGTVAMTVTDTTAPALSLPANIVAEATSAAGASVGFITSASDLVDGARAVVCTPAPGATFGLGITTVSCTSSDTRGNTAHGGFTVKVQDTTAPALQAHADITVPAASAAGAVVSYALPVATDAVDASVEVVCAPASGGTFAVGQNTVTCTATDDAGNQSSSSFQVNVEYSWSGFLRPVDNLPVVNTVKAGSAVPVKFSLGGDMGLAIFQAGYPRTTMMACSTGALEDAITETSTAGGSSLTYDATAAQYIYVWKTDKAWAGGCRQLQIRFADGSLRVANFRFMK